MKIKNMFLTLLAVIGIASVATAGTPPLTLNPGPAFFQKKQDDGVKAQSVILDYKEGSLGVTYINDGIDGLAGLSGRIWQVSDKLRLNGIVVSDFKSNAKYYAGALFTYRVYESKKGIKIDLGAGVKGLDISNGFNDVSFATKRPLIWSVGVSFPIGN